MKKCFQIDPFVSFSTFMHNRFYICFHTVMLCINRVYAMPLLFFIGCGWCKWSSADLVTLWSGQSYFQAFSKVRKPQWTGLPISFISKGHDPERWEASWNFGHWFINWIQLQPKEISPEQSKNFALNYSRERRILLLEQRAVKTVPVRRLAFALFFVF